MTEYEKLTTDRDYLADMLDRETPLWQEVNEWYCHYKCPYQTLYYSLQDDPEYSCMDRATPHERILLWLDKEHKEVADGRV